ncbi:MAG: T9SS type A sorting domain-containing protein, partial [Bacteroidia bacterium]|nr:T9SS type A sorting domain-containing protein [Bacteroidia bacterium]
TYTLANAPITYTPGVPAGANIMFVISDTTASGTGIQIGSNFIVDDVSLNFASGLGETNHDLLSAPYPNPASGIVNIPFRSEGQARLEMLVLDQIGREVRRIEYSGLAANQYKEVLDISAYATGLYTVRLQTDGKVLGQTSFMIGKQ